MVVYGHVIERFTGSGKFPVGVDCRSSGWMGCGVSGAMKEFVEKCDEIGMEAGGMLLRVVW